mmetsp:Transcript_12616/g.46597  ORF Transcript_12616/g.46597 Transcript_12616/m.46597 type:complete len:81 (-) Transcript_12616:69-311(-)
MSVDSRVGMEEVGWRGKTVEEWHQTKERQHEWTRLYRSALPRRHAFWTRTYFVDVHLYVSPQIACVLKNGGHLEAPRYMT